MPLSAKTVKDRTVKMAANITGEQTANSVLSYNGAYAPQVGCQSEEKEEFWIKLEEVVEGVPREERSVIGSDFNGHVGEGNRGDEEVLAWPGSLSDARLPKSRELRLVDDGDAMPCSGVLQLKHRHKWQYSCAENWNEAWTLLACSDLKCGKSVTHYFTSTGTPFTGLMLICQGQETSLLHCASMMKSCNTRVGIVCRGNLGEVTEKEQYTAPTESPSANSSAGLFQWLRTALLLSGLTGMVFSVIAVEILARRRRCR